ncbi:hypothetical protein KY321_00935 [Candidatus Woesearchaeota archaeon]|nr:hypothetical protein [Candidatus Woesearchaeota archaeon]
MNKDYNIDDKNNLLSKILSSKHFLESEVSTILLKYLFDCAINGITPKEKTIGQDLYNKKDLETSSDSYVRSNVYKLRKKLHAYYDNEGLNDSIKLVIPKGGYHVEFIEKQLVNTKKTKFLVSGSIFIPLLTLLICVVIIYFLMNITGIKNSYTLKDHPFWKIKAGNNNPLCLAISNLKMYNEFDTEFNRDRSILDLNYSSIDNIEELMKDNPERNLSLLNYGFVLMSNPENYFRLGQIYNEINNEIIYKWSSEITWNDIKKNNIFFIGDLRSIYKLSSLFTNTHLQLESPYSFLWQKDDTVKTFSFIPHKDSDWESYAAVLKIPGPNNNNLTLIVGTTYSARIHMMEKLTDLEFLDNLYKEFDKKFKSRPEYFELLFKVKGFQRVAHSSKLLYFDRLIPNQFNWE